MTKRGKLAAIWGSAALAVGLGITIPTVVVWSLKSNTNSNGNNNNNNNPDSNPGTNPDSPDGPILNPNTNYVDMTKEELDQILADKDFAKDWINENIFNNDPDKVVDSVTDVVMGIDENNNITIDFTVQRGDTTENVSVTAQNLFGMDKVLVEQKIREYFGSKVLHDSEFSQENIIDTLSKAYELLNNDSLASATPTLNDPLLNEDNFKIIDLVLGLNDNWLFVDLENQTTSSDMTLDDVLTHSHLIDDDILSTEIFNQNRFGDLDDSLTNLDGVKTQIDAILPEGLTVTEISTTKNYQEDANGKLTFDLTITLSSGQVIEKVVTTNLSVIHFDNTSFIEWLKTDVTDPAMIESDEFKTNLLKFITTNSDVTLDNAIFGPDLLSEYSGEKGLNNNLTVMLYNFVISLADNLCLFIDGSPIENNTLNKQLTNINTVLALDGVNAIINNFINATLDNYTSFFHYDDVKEANKPENINPGRLTSDKLSEMSNGLFPVGAISEEPGAISVRKNTQADDGTNPWLYVDVTIKLKDPFTYNGKSEITLTARTGIYDPSSKYNCSLFIWSGDDVNSNNIVGINSNLLTASKTYTNNKIILPSNTQFWRWIANSTNRITFWLNYEQYFSEFVANYAYNLIDLGGSSSTFEGAKITIFRFENLPSFTGFVKGEINDSFKGTDATDIIVKNCPEFQNIGQDSTFRDNALLERLYFTDCPKLTWLPQNFVRGSLKLKWVDFRGCNISGGANDVFWDVQKQTISFYCDNDTSFQGVNKLLMQQNSPGNNHAVWSTSTGYDPV